MALDLIADRSHTPSMSEITLYIGGGAEDLWRGFIEFVERNYGTSPNLTFSACAGKPGWNVKYRKSGKALCTLYPEKGSFSALLALGEEACLGVIADGSSFSARFRDIYEKSTPMMGLRWLMLRVDDSETAEDLKRALLTKVPPRKRA